MAEFLSIEVTGNDELQRSLFEAVRRLEDPKPLLQAMGAVLVQNINRRFDSKTDPSGRRWAPLAASTRAKYDRADTERSGPRAGQVVRSGSLLERTRIMRESLNPTVSDGFVDVGMNRITDDGKWQIPLLHETGTKRMPRRGLFFADPDSGTLGAEDDADLDAEILAFLDDVFGA